jgi:hypothetical protein
MRAHQVLNRDQLAVFVTGLLAPGCEEMLPARLQAA